MTQVIKVFKLLILIKGERKITKIGDKSIYKDALARYDGLRVELQDKNTAASDDERKSISKLLDEVSPALCLAKWTQVTLDLVHGTNHSCHHPKRHLIEIDDIKQDPAALHNTLYKREVRAQMLEGKRPDECLYCWNIEDTPGEHYSDRIIKSSDPWSLPYFKEILSAGSEQNYNPHYLEVMFDKACNFACSYCLADISSSVQREMDEYGRYPLFYANHRENDPQWKRDLGHYDENPFVAAFWKWLPDIWEDLHTLRVTGGEPLLSKHTFKLLDYIIAHPQQNLTFAINSNLGMDDQRLSKYFHLIKQINEQGNLKSNEIYVSIDTVGEQAQYIRHGLDDEKFIRNLEHVLELKACDRVVLMVTFNLLSVPRFDELLKIVANLKADYPELILDLSYLREPEYLRANLLGDIWNEKMKEYLFFMKENSSVFSEHEVNKLDRIYQWMKKTIEDDAAAKRMKADFFVFVNEYDRRYGKNFLKTFPELKDFYIGCKKEKFLLSF